MKRHLERKGYTQERLLKRELEINSVCCMQMQEQNSADIAQIILKAYH